jgi:uncharacterized protein YxeA
MKKTKLIIIAVIALVIILAAAYFFYKKASAISTAELKVAIEDLKKVDPKKVDESNYPKVLGKYAENGLTLVEAYQCADICPDNASLEIIYSDIKTKEDCTKINGLVLGDPVWGIYRACTPKIE